MLNILPNILWLSNGLGIVGIVIFLFSIGSVDDDDDDKMSTGFSPGHNLVTRFSVSQMYSLFLFKLHDWENDCE